MSIIKYNNKTIKKLEYNTSEVNKMYYDDNVAYGVDGGSPEPPTPPSFDGKWLATYAGGTTSSAECDASSVITSGEITLTDLVSVEIGDCVTSIGNGAFRNCSSLTSVTIGNSVTSIDYNSFANCRSLKSVTIPNSVTSIGNYAFRYCSSLKSITCLATTPPTLGGTSVFNSTNNCPIFVPAASVNAYKSASGWSAYASRIQAIP